MKTSRAILWTGVVLLVAVAQAAEPGAGADLRAGPGVVSKVGLVALALVPPLLLWIALALRRAWLADGWRARRAARGQVEKLLNEISRRGTRPTRVELEFWRNCCVAAWGEGLAVPTAAEISARVTDEPTARALWGMLWAETEAAMYAARAEVAVDWVVRAKQALAAAKPMRHMTWLPNRWRYWWLTVFVGLIMVGPASGADVKAGDWAAHGAAAVNAAKAEAWGEAAAHAAAAYLLNPGEPAVRAMARASAAQVDGVDPGLQRLIEGKGMDRVVGAMSVARWQVVMLMGAAMVALGLSAGIYRRGWGWGLATLGVALVTAGWGAERRFGLLADGRAAVVTRTAEVRAIPSELTTGQQAATLAAGAVVVVDRSFLSWDHVRLQNGGAGWVRAEALVRMYRIRSEVVVADERRD